MSDGRDALAAAVDWATEADPAVIFEHRDFVRRSLHQLAEQERWSDVILLARATQGPMASGRRWGVWKEILDHARTAAEVSGDRSAEAWARHQLGTRSLLMDDLSEAWPHLHTSLAIRDQIDESDAAAVTRQNLQLLPLALAGLMTALTVMVGSIALLIPTVEREDVEAEPRDPVLDITNEVVDLDGEQVSVLDNGDAALRIELVNRGNVDLEGLTVEPAALVADGGDDACRDLTLDEKTCELVLNVGAVEGASQLVLVCYADCSQRGDSGVLLRR